MALLRADWSDDFLFSRPSQTQISTPVVAEISADHDVIRYVFYDVGEGRAGTPASRT